MQEDVDRLWVAVEPSPGPSWLLDAVRSAGAETAPVTQASALIWRGGRADALGELLRHGPNITWVQLPSAGVERYAALLDDRHTWTCAKVIYGRQVAEHALALVLAGAHCLPQFARWHRWQKTETGALSGSSITIVGGGGIAQELIRMLRPFNTDITVVRRHVAPLEGASRVLATADLLEALGTADTVVLAAALTPETEGMIGARELSSMKEGAWLVNVGRGKLVRTDDLVAALRRGQIGGAGLDVTDPEPLPDGHPLWDLANCLITSHSANPGHLEHRSYAALVSENMRRRRAGEDLLGLVNPRLRY